MKRRAILAALAFSVVSVLPMLAQDEYHGAKQFPIQMGEVKTNYWALVPPNYDEGWKWPVFVVVHSVGASGRDMIDMFKDDAAKDGFILVCPTFLGQYFALGKEEDTLLLLMIKEISKTHNVDHTRIFLAGIAAGADYALKFALKQSQYVLAVSSHSPSAVPEVGQVKRRFPVLMTAGAADEVNLPSAVKLAEVLTKANFTVKTLYYKGIKVEWNVEGQEECREWFRKTAIGLDKDTCEKLKEVHADAKAKLEAEQYSDAARAITAALKDVRSRDNFLTYQLKALLKKIDKEGDSRRVTAERSLQNEPERLALELEGLAKLFAGSDAGKRIQASLQRVRKPAAGAGTPDGSAGKETSVEKETPGGQDTKPPATTGSDTDDRKFLSKLNNAKLLAQAGKKEAAIENLKKLLQENPESKHAAEAQKLLDQLEKGGK